MPKSAFVLDTGSFLGSVNHDRFQSVTQSDLNSVTVTLEPVPRMLKDIGVLIYTSGTSGKPKAVSIKNWLLLLTSTTTRYVIHHTCLMHAFLSHDEFCETPSYGIPKLVVKEK